MPSAAFMTSIATNWPARISDEFGGPLQSGEKKLVSG